MSNDTPRASYLVLVPREPTDEMLEAGAPECEYTGTTCARLCYDAMLAAAPQPPALGGEPVLWKMEDESGYDDHWMVPEGDGPEYCTRDEGPWIRADDHRSHVAPLLAEIERLKILSVTNILLAVVPGDGEGHEVYAKSVDDVVSHLTKLDERLEAAESRIAELEAGQPATAQLEMADVVKAHMEIPHCPVLTSNQCHALAMKLNAKLNGVTPDEQ
jgi:hypothetical protein